MSKSKWVNILWKVGGRGTTQSFIIEYQGLMRNELRSQESISGGSNSWFHPLDGDGKKRFPESFLPEWLLLTVS